MTFFAWAGARRGRIGTGQPTATAFSVPVAALAFWRERLQAHGVASEATTRWEAPVLSFVDPDGLRLEFVGVDDDQRVPWTHAVPAEHAIRGFHGATITVAQPTATDAALQSLGFREAGRDGSRTRYVLADGAAGAVLDVVVASAPHGLSAVGTVHHIAWRVADDAAQAHWLATLPQRGFSVSPVMDREYFHSIYFREPGGVLFEIATDQPGFAVDEAPETLGTALKLPPWYEAQRAEIEARLPTL